MTRSESCAAGEAPGGVPGAMKIGLAGEKHLSPRRHFTVVIVDTAVSPLRLIV